jgi:cobaltochelatase CobS
MNIKLEISKLPHAVLNTILIANGHAVEPKKSNAITLVDGLVTGGYITLHDALNTKANAVTNASTEVRIPDDIKQSIVNAQAEIVKATDSVERVRDVANRLLDDSLRAEVNNARKFEDLSNRLNNELKVVQGVDYSKVSVEIRAQVTKLFESFRQSTPVAELTTVANALPVFERKQIKDVFVNVVLEYEHEGNTIAFGDNFIDVWNDPLAPARVDDYIFDAKNLHQTLCALDDSLPDNVWLAGERGTGKTEFVTQVASRLGRRLFKVSFDEAIERADFIGADKIRTDEKGVAQCVFVEGIISKAIQQCGAIVLLDELGFARAQSLASLHPVLEKSVHRAITISDTGLRIPVASHVVFFCADNSNGHGDESGNFQGVRQQNSAFIDRFSYTLQFNYLPHKEEVALLCSRTGIPHDASNLLVKFANTAREKARAGLLTQPPSLRQLLAWARSIKKGIPVAIAFDSAIINKFPSDCEAELRGIFSAVIDTHKLQSYLSK